MYQRTWSNQAAQGAKPGHRHEKPWLLVVESRATAEVTEFSRFRDAGFEVAVCSGPYTSGACPLVRAGHCALADEADVVLFGLPLDRTTAQEVLWTHRRRRPEAPVVVQAPHARRGYIPDGDAGITVLHPSASVDGQVRALWRALLSSGWDSARG